MQRASEEKTDQEKNLAIRMSLKNHSSLRFEYQAAGARSREPNNVIQNDVEMLTEQRKNYNKNIVKLIKTKKESKTSAHSR